MARDIAPLTNALNEATPGNQTDVYTLLAAWDQSIRAALERGGGDRFREVTKQQHPRVIHLVDRAAGDESDDVDWAFLQECIEAYPPGEDDHHCSQILANVIARDVIRTRIDQGPDATPVWAVGHSEIAVLDRIVNRTDTDSEPWTMGTLRHVAYADPEAAITLLERLLRSPDTREDLLFLRSLELVLEQDFPEFPQYWEPETEFDYSVTITDDQRERLLAVLGETVHPKRLQKFDDQFAFDLQRAADEYGADSNG